MSLSSNSPRHSPEKSFSEACSSSESYSRERRINSGSRGENIYAKQYRKRESYERKQSPIKQPVMQLTEASPKLKSTSQVKFNFAPRGVPQTTEINRTQDVITASNKPVLPTTKRKPQTVAQMLLAKAKGGKSLKLRKQQQIITIKQSVATQPIKEPEIVTNDSSQVRSRSGRVVKAKKRDYDDLITSPRCESKKSSEQSNNSSGKRTLDGAEFPVAKIQRVNESVGDDIAAKTQGEQLIQQSTHTTIIVILFFANANMSI